MAKYKIEWSTDARSDLLDILDFYIRRNNNAIYSKKLNAGINKSAKLLSRNPLLGMKTDYDAVRTLITDEYQIIYEIFNQLILIVMIWVCRRYPDDKKIVKRIK